MKIDFIVPGFSKCGTTTLCALLAEHPEIGIPPSHKEIGFFSNYFDLGWSWYESQFNEVAGKRFIGEGSTNYSTEEHGNWVAGRIAYYLPDTRLIFIARNPITRIESIFREMHHSGSVFNFDPPFDIGEALRTVPNMINDTLYWKCINAYRQFIPDSKILMLFLEDLERDPAGQIAKCFRFIGADPTVRINDLDRRLNTKSSKFRDTNVLRWVKVNSLTRRCWHRLSKEQQEWLARTFKLRIPFGEKIDWPAETRTWVLDQIFEDSQKFLEFYGKSADFWGLKAFHDRATQS
jgi:hypothetical protein